MFANNQKLSTKAVIGLYADSGLYTDTEFLPTCRHIICRQIAHFWTIYRQGNVIDYAIFSLTTLFEGDYDVMYREMYSC